MQNRPDVSVKLVLRADNHVLMLHRTSGSWEFPGGRLEWGESPEDALKRELVEELDYIVSETPKFIHLYNYISKNKSQHSVILHYLVTVTEMPYLHTTTEEADAEVTWLTKNELLAVVPNAAFVEHIYSPASPTVIT